MKRKLISGSTPAQHPVFKGAAAEPAEHSFVQAVCRITITDEGSLAARVHIYAFTCLAEDGRILSYSTGRDRA